MPSIGLIAPPSTWYRPRNSRVRSIATTSFASSTTQIVALLRRGSRQIAQVSCSETLPQTLQNRTLSRTSIRISARRVVSKLCGLEDVERDALRRLRSDAGEASEFVDQVLDDALVHGLRLPSGAGRTWIFELHLAVGGA